MPDARRVAFLGIGHPLRRDDAAGVAVCDRIRPRLRGRGDVLVVSGGSAPENYVGALRAFAPDRVIVVDAARMGETPGTLLRIDPADPRAWGASTHTLPLPMFCRYLEETLGCDVVLLGIEPADTSFGEGLSPEVERAVSLAARQATRELRAIAPVSVSRPHPPCPPLRRATSSLERPLSAERGDEETGERGAASPPPSPLKETIPLPRRVSTSGGTPSSRGKGEGWGTTWMSLYGVHGYEHNRPGEKERTL